MNLSLDRVGEVFLIFRRYEETTFVLCQIFEDAIDLRDGGLASGDESVFRDIGDCAMLLKFGKYDDIEFESFGGVNSHDADARIGWRLGLVFLNFL